MNPRHQTFEMFARSSTSPDGEQPPMPTHADIGDTIEHKRKPGFQMTVRAVTPCRPDVTRPEPHSRYRVIAPEGAFVHIGPAGEETFLCAYDVRKVRS